jgi:molybdate transport system substrate-binding protein
VVALATIAAGCGRHPRGTVKIAAAADLAKAFEELGRVFASRTGLKPVFTFGSSGLLAKQLAEGAPYAVFAAANQSYVDQLTSNGVCDPATKRLYARGRLVVWSKTAVVEKLADLTQPAIKKIAIANPEHAPYGIAARQALRANQLWDPVASKMVYAENVRQALQWAEDGQADAAIVALSLAVVTEGGRTFAIDPALHEPLDQAVAVCGGGQAAADGARFVELLTSAEGRELMQRYGFVLPTP